MKTVKRVKLSKGLGYDPVFNILNEDENKEMGKWIQKGYKIIEQEEVPVLERPIYPHETEDIQLPFFKKEEGWANEGDEIDVHIAIESDPYVVTGSNSAPRTNAPISESMGVVKGEIIGNHVEFLEREIRNGVIGVGKAKIEKIEKGGKYSRYYISNK